MVDGNCNDRGGVPAVHNEQTPSERSQGEWWDTERLDPKVRCVVDGDCSHSKRAVQEQWKSTRLELTLCNHEFFPYRERLRV